MASSPLDQESALRAFIEEAEGILGTRWTQITDWLRDRKTLAALETLIAAGRGAEVLSPADLERAAQVLAADVNDIHAEAARRVASRLTEQTDQLVRYDVANPRAVAAMQARSLRFVGGIAEEQQAVIRAVLADGVQRGTNPRDMARQMRASIGLTPTQADAVETYRRSLERAHLAPAAAMDRELRDARSDGAIARAGSSGKPLDAARIERMVERYRGNAVAYRSELIARSNALPAVHEGIVDGFNNAIDNGQLRADSLVRTWRSAPGPRTRDTHRQMNKQTTGIDGVFTSPSGATLRYPGDPSAPASETVQCRCCVTTKIGA